MPEDYHSSQVQSWFVSVQRELWHGALVDLAYVGNRADDLLLFANFNQAAPNNSAGTIPLQARRPIPDFADITYSFNGGKSRYHAFQAKFDWRIGAGFSILNSLTFSQDEGQRRRLAREHQRQLPGAAGLQQPRRRLRSVGAYHQPYNNTTSFVSDLPFGTRPSLREQRVAGRSTRSSAAGRSPASTSFTPGEQVTLTYTPGAAFQVSRHPAGLPRREQLSAERHRRSCCCRGSAQRSELVQPRRAWPCRPIRASRSATRRATTCAGR